MPSERLLYEFPDGNRQTRQPAPVPKAGDRFTRFGREFVVIEVYDRGDVMVVTLVHTADTGNGNE
jgi:hypothetical protein